MENYELQHWGIRGMRWGIRRFQNKNGSLTPAGRKRYGNDEKSKPETDEERRTRALKSTDASEIYKNRDVLTTNEIRERMDRINVEKQLGQMSESTKTTGMDRVNNALAIGRKVNEVYEFTQTPVMKALAKKMGFKTGDVAKKFDLDKVMKNIDTMSDEQIKKAADRVGNVDKIKNAYEKAKRKADAKDDKADKEKTDKKETKDDSTKAEEPEIIFNTNEKKRDGYRDEKTSKSDTIIDGEWIDLDTTVSDLKGTEIVQSGRNFVSGLLEEPKR